MSETTPSSASPISRPIAVLSGILSTGVAIGLMFWARAAYQIRTLPERVMEWLLLFVPTSLFEKGLQTFGANAKDLALYGAYIVMALLLFVLAIFAVRRSITSIVLASAALWLFAMAVVMPVTGAGFFATGLLQDVLLTNLSYLGIAFAYATVLLLVRVPLVAGSPKSGATASSANDSVARRAFVGGVLGTGVTYALTALTGRTAGTINSDLPLATIPRPPTEPPVVSTTAPSVSSPNAIPTATNVAHLTPTAVTAAGAPAAASPTAVSAVAQTSVAASPSATSVATAVEAAPTPPALTPSPVPAVSSNVVVPAPPPPARQIARNKDGSLTGAVPPPGQIAPLYTPNNVFYITTKNAGGDPVVNGTKWRLAIDGAVVKPVQLDLPLLYQLPTARMTKTLECISNYVQNCGQVPFGCNLISNSAWKGVRLSDILALAGGLQPGVQSIAIYSADEYVGSIPNDPTLLQEALLAYEMNGQVLPYEHGYPARLLTPGRYGMKSPKWVIAIRPMKSVLVDWFGQRGWNHDAIVRTMTRIDVPLNGQTLTAGPQRIGGIAYAGSRGIGRVDFSPDGGKSWQKASIIDKPTGIDQWVQWQGTFSMPASGTVQLTARSVDGTGAPQIAAYNPTQPDGATGLMSIQVKAAPA